MAIFTAEELQAYGSRKLGAPVSNQPQKKKVTGIKRVAASALPIVLGAGGAVLGTVAGPAGTVAGGAGGSALGEALRQRILGEGDNQSAYGLNWKKIGTEGVLGAIPGVGKAAKGGVQAAKGARQSAAEILTAQGRNAKARRDVTAQGKQVAGLTDDVAETAATATKTAKPSILSKLKSSGSEIRQSVANPQVRASVGGAQKEAEIGARVSQVKGLSAKTKYKNLDAEMSRLSSKIEPQLAKSKKTVKTDDLITGIRANAEQSSHFLAGDSLYEKQLSAVLTDLAAKTKGSQKLTGRQLYDYKTGMDMSSVFNKLDRGADLNPKEAARLAVWSQLDDAITKAAPGVKTLTKEQSLLIQGAAGLKKASDKTIGVPILGLKSKRLEQASQGTRELIGRGLEKVGGGVAKESSEQGSSLLRKMVKPTAQQGASRLLVGPLLSQPTPEEPPVEDAAISESPDLLASQEAMTLPEEQAGSDYQAAAQEALASGDYKAFDAIMKMQASFGQKTGANKPLSAEASKVIANANSGLTSLSELRGIINEQGGVSKATLVPGRDMLGGLAGNALGTAEYDTVARNLTDVITRLRTGAALTESEERFYKNQVPKAFDSPKVVEQKMRMFEDLFRSVSNRTGSAGTDLQEAAGL